ncbi:hypothetical protein [Vibrio phage XZ1]|uniref:Uncharacterized protein n=1 Tax=Vibrio phage ValKK3 TaxID=1610855 RepID=A0A0D4DAA5_9CAUD|nr:hypothetical protein AVU32_gp068 [Vibrio phage ValKK3]QBX06282.1 hypothetical protein Va3_329 [Vibrio phage Va3]QNJ55294.1 hypothetical protein vBValMR11Z_368 [Vibrio phage vB_ValM_R11Z]UOL51335.1 hypothetical protein [Vibrio phage XZ1]URQ03395.1 hypothetical protein PVA23_18 [Vibrio phage PVA23]AJT60909.1 hypothetical protein [Vibrio phage ValKK3]
MYNGNMNTPAGIDLDKRSESYEDFLLKSNDNSEYSRRVKRAIKAKRAKRGY